MTGGEQRVRSNMSSPAAIAAAEPGMQEAAVVPGAGSPAGVVLPKLPSWGASGWQALFKQTSAGTCLRFDLTLRACMASVTLSAVLLAKTTFGCLTTADFVINRVMKRVGSIVIRASLLQGHLTCRNWPLTTCLLFCTGLPSEL